MAGGMAVRGGARARGAGLVMRAATVESVRWLPPPPPPPPPPPHSPQIPDPRVVGLDGIYPWMEPGPLLARFSSSSSRAPIPGARVGG